jgi:cell division septal protein FtsQ
MRLAQESIYPGSIEYLRRENNYSVKRKKRKRSLTISAFYMVLILLTIAAIGAAVYLAGNFVLSWEKLNISSYKLINVPEREYPQVKEVLSEFRGNLLAVDLRLLKTKLLSIRTIKDVTISRHLPSSIRVEFLLRKPVYQYLTEGKYIVLSHDGIALKSLEKRDKDYIIIKSLKKWSKEILQLVYSEIKEIQREVEFVDFNDIYGISIKLNDENAMIYPGETGINEKIKLYLKIKNKLNLNVNKIINIDMRIKDRIYLEFEEEV